MQRTIPRRLDNFSCVWVVRVSVICLGWQKTLPCGHLAVSIWVGLTRKVWATTLESQVPGSIRKLYPLVLRVKALRQFPCVKPIPLTLRLIPPSGALR